MTSANGSALFERWSARGEEVSVVGLGKSGVSATLLLRSRGIPVYASDTGSGATYERWAATLHAAGAAVDIGGHDLGRISHSAAVVVAPGVPPNVPALAVAREADLEIYAEVDIGFLALKDTHCIGITGTNGKTTTTSLIAHVLSTAGLRAETAGNIGRPLCDVALAEQPPDYYGDKAQLFRNADSSSVWVTNADDPVVQGMVSSVPGRHVRFSTERRAEGWYDRAEGLLMLGESAVLPREALPLLGDHNVANALAAALVASQVGSPMEQIAEGLRSFRAIPHRVEPIREVDGVLWINDSKSTNITSTEVAIAAVERPFVLLLGGRHKGEPYTRLVERLRDRCRAVVAYGEAGPLIVKDLGSSLTVIPAETFDEVLMTARSLARPGDAVLLSPACSSYDMFRNYEERGDRFRAVVEAL
jgi:UDP-N-acetylmuramoylalanine--D-glutamate ligase